MSMCTEENGVLPDKRLYGAKIPCIGTASKEHLPKLMELAARNVLYTEGEPNEVVFDASIPAIGPVELDNLPAIVGLVHKNKVKPDEDGIVFPNGKVYDAIIVAVGVQNKQYLPQAMELVGKNVAQASQSVSIRIK